MLQNQLDGLPRIRKRFVARFPLGADFRQGRNRDDETALVSGLQNYRVSMVHTAKVTDLGKPCKVAPDYAVRHVFRRGLTPRHEVATMTCRGGARSDPIHASRRNVVRAVSSMTVRA